MRFQTELSTDQEDALVKLTEQWNEQREGQDLSALTPRDVFLELVNRALAPYVRQLARDLSADLSDRFRKLPKAKRDQVEKLLGMRK